MLNYAQAELRNVLPLAARTTSQIMTPASVNLGGWRGIRLKIHVPTQTTSASNVFTVYEQDEAGTKYTLGASAAITGQGDTMVTIYPGLSTAATTINNVLGRLFSVDVVAGNANPMTYALSIELLP